jgi:hypothetical protein
MSAYNIQADRFAYEFPLDLSPLVFNEATDLVRDMLKESNEKTQKDKEIVKIPQSCGFLAVVFIGFFTFIGVPFVIAYICITESKVKKALDRMMETWKSIADSYNPKLNQYGVFVRFMKNAEAYVANRRTHYRPIFIYEFTFATNKHIHVIVNNEMAKINPINQNAPPQHVELELKKQ